MKSALPALVYCFLFSFTPELPALVPPPSSSVLASIESTGASGRRVSKVRPRKAQRAQPKSSESMIMFTLR